MRVADVPPGWGKLIATLIAAVVAIVPLVIVVHRPGNDAQPTRVEIVREVVAGVAAGVTDDRIRQEQRAACVAALNRTPVAILRRVPPAVLRETIVSCAAPFRPPVAKDEHQPRP